MTDPKDALETARRAVAQNPDAYGSVEQSAPGPLPVDPGRLTDWAFPDPSGYEVGSVRAWGAPITWFKRLLLRLLAQYHVQLIADQSRFNAVLLGYVRSLEERITALEARLGDDLEEPDSLEDDYA